MTNKLKNFLLLFLSIILSVYFLETLLSIQKLYQNNEIINTKKPTEKLSKSQNFDNRSKIEIYRDLKNENRENDYIFNFVFKDIYIDRFNNYLKSENLVPLAGKSSSKVIHCNESGYWSIYDSDKYGFNNINKLWDDNKKKLLLLGDSFTHGACVNYEFTLAGWFNKKIDDYSTLSLGSDAKGPILSLASLKEYYPKRLKHVVYFYYEGNDLIDLKREKKNKILLKYFSDDSFSQNLKSKQKIIDAAWQEMFLNSSYNLSKNRLNRFLKLRFVKENIRNIFFNSNYKKKIERKDIKDLEKVILKMKNFSLQKNSKFTVVYLPSVHRYFEVNDNTFGYQSYDQVLEMFKNNKINYIDIKKLLFDKTDYPEELFPLKKKNHYSETTYEKIVEIVKKELF